MLIGNTILLSVLMGMMILQQFGGSLYLMYRKWRYYKKVLIGQESINVDIFSNHIFKGFGLIVNRELLTSGNRPLTFKTEDRANEYKIKKKLKGAKVIYQVWNPKLQTVNIGEIQNVSEKLKKSQS